MPSVASTIFKIKAIADYISPSPHLLSFRKGQPFYALAADYERGVYFVSTQFATPFARNAVSGLVPLRYFVEVDLMSKDNAPPSTNVGAAAAAAAAHANAQVAPARDAAQPATRPAPQEARATAAALYSQNTQQQQQQQQPTPVTEHTAPFQLSPEWALLMQSQQAIAIAEVAVSRGASPGSDEFRIRVVRGASAHTIVRSTADLVSLHRSMMLSYAASSLPEFPLSMTSSTSSSLSVTSPTHAGSALADDMATKAQRTDLYLNALASHSWTRSATDRRLPASLATFFQPRNGKESELSAYTGSIRRDSGFSDPSSGVHATQVKQPASALTASSSSIMNNRAPIAPARSHPNLKDVCPWTEQAVVPQPQPHQQHQFQINMGLSSKPASFQQQQQQLQPSSNTSTRKRSVASEFFSHLFGSSTSTSTSTSSHTTSAF